MGDNRDAGRKGMGGGTGWDGRCMVVRMEWLGRKFALDWLGLGRVGCTRLGLGSDQKAMCRIWNCITCMELE